MSGGRNARRAASRRRRWMLGGATVTIAAIVIAIALAATAGSGPSRGSREGAAGASATGPTAPGAIVDRSRMNQRTHGQRVARMLGQMIVASFAGFEPSKALLARIRAGQVGGVILFADNVAGGLGQARALIQELQAVSSQGHNPPLLIMTDQEGGEVKRLPGPPSLAANQMTSTTVAFSQGQATASMLRGVGVNLDLAPVADVERVAGSFLGSRSFGSSPSLVGQNACAFADGLASEHVAFTLKHFPGLGRATASTDVAPVAIAASPSDIREDYVAYRRCGSNPMGLVMVSSATYPGLTGPLPAVMAPATYEYELPLAVPGGRPVTISDDLQSPAITSQASPALHAINAGLDLLMYAQTEDGSAAAYSALLNKARSGLVSQARIRAAYEAITALKRRLR